MPKKLPPIVLIAGTFCYPEVWDDMKFELEQRGYDVHAPPLRHHELPFLEGALAVAETSLLDFTADFIELIKALERPPVIIGWSMGGLIAQLVAQQVEHAGLMLLSPAPAAGMFKSYPSMLKTIQHHFSRWGSWRKALMPDWETFFWSTGHLQDVAFMREVYTKLKAESGRAYFEMGMWYFDRKRAAKVSPVHITGPVLVVSGHDDRIVRAVIGRRTAARFRGGEFVELSNQDHMLPAGSGLARVMAEFDRWIVSHDIE